MWVNAPGLNSEFAPPDPRTSRTTRPNVRGGDRREGLQNLLAITDVVVVDRKNNLPVDSMGAEANEERTVKLNLQGRSWTLVANACVGGAAAL